MKVQEDAFCGLLSIAVSSEAMPRGCQLIMMSLIAASDCARSTLQELHVFPFCLLDTDCFYCKNFLQSIKSLNQVSD